MFGYALSIVEDLETENLLFLGTDDGLYYTLNAGDDWMKFDSKIFPTVSTKDLIIHPREHDLVIGTFGRAIWILDDIRPFRALANNPEIIKKNLHLFDPPKAYLTQYQQPNGSRFGADAIYNAENKKYGGMLTYFYKAGDKKEKDSLNLNIYDGERLIRTLITKAPKETGFHRWYWSLNEKGVTRPSRKVIKSKSEPRGVSVKPGVYRIIMGTASVTSEVSIEVHSDPRLAISDIAIDERYTYSKIIEGYLEQTTQAVNQLRHSKETLANYKKRISKKVNKTLIEQIDEASKEIDSIINSFLGKEDKRQGIVRNPENSVVKRINSASRYIRSRPNGITETEEKLMKHALDDLKKALNQTNSFYDENWEELKTSIEAVELTEFKEIVRFEID